MEWTYALLVGVLYSASLYMMLRRSMVKLIIGVILLSNATYLLIFTTGGLNHASSPLIAEDQKSLTGAYADPLPQALILTAIVIGFAFLAFTIVLLKRVFISTNNDDVDKFNTTDT